MYKYEIIDNLSMNTVLTDLVFTWHALRARVARYTREALTAKFRRISLTA